MSNSNVDDVVKRSKVDSQRLLLVILGTEKARIPKELTKNIRKPFRGLIIIRQKDQKVKKLFDEIKHIGFRKAREIPRVKESRTLAPEKRTYTIVSYRFESPTAKQKKKAQRLIRRSPSIRLRPGVLLFPFLRTKDMERVYSVEGKSVPLSAGRFVQHMKESGADVQRWSRLRVIGLRSQNLLDQACDSTIRSQLETVEERIGKVRVGLRRKELTKRTLKERYTTLHSRFREIRSAAVLFKKLWSKDYEKVLKRTYNKLLRLRREISDYIQ